MESFRSQFKRLEAWLFQKPMLYGLGCFMGALAVGLVLAASHDPLGRSWLVMSPILGLANWAYAVFYQWRRNRRV
jgi:hypothetical protein